MDQFEARSKVIVALDVASVSEAIKLVQMWMVHVGGFKVGLELIYSTIMSLITLTPSVAENLLSELRRLFHLLGNSEFLDVKLGDIGNTVGGASNAICRLYPAMFNVHVSAGSPAQGSASKHRHNDENIQLTTETPTSGGHIAHKPWGK